jgi:hypothetical protein
VTENHGVGGSIPPLGTIKIKHLRDDLGPVTLSRGNTRGNGPQAISLLCISRRAFRLDRPPYVERERRLRRAGRGREGLSGKRPLAVIRIAITAEAFDAIAAMLTLRSVIF